MVKKLYRYLLAYFLWIVTLCLGLWFIYVSYSAVQALLGSFFIKNSFPRLWQAEFYNEVYLVIVGLAWLIVFVIGEEYFRKSVEKQNTIKRFSKIAGPVIILIFISDLSMALTRGIGYISWVHWLILAIELGIGVFLVQLQTCHSRPNAASKSSKSTARPPTF